MPKHYEIEVKAHGIKIIQRAAGSSILEVLEEFIREDDSKELLLEGEANELTVRRV